MPEIIKSCYCETCAETLDMLTAEPIREGKVEIPADQYDELIGVMAQRDIARDCVCKGGFTYTQARIVALSKTIQGVRWNEDTHMVGLPDGMSMTFAMMFAIARWDGETVEAAIAEAVSAEADIGRVAAGLHADLSVSACLIGGAEGLIRKAAPQTLTFTVNVVRTGFRAIIQRIGALMSANLITRVISSVALMIIDVQNYMRGRISKTQLFIDLTNTLLMIVGGVIGWFAGIAVIERYVSGNFFVGVGGGFIGGSILGIIFTKIASKILNRFIENDEIKILKIVEVVFRELVVEYLINTIEAEGLLVIITRRLKGATVKAIHAAPDRAAAARVILEPFFMDAAAQRQVIVLPSQEEITGCLCKNE
jgi:hypothetical protein